MESVLYSDGQNLQVSNLRIAVGGKTIAVQNIASVDLHRVKGKRRTGGYLLAGFGLLLFIGAIGANSGLGATVTFLMMLSGILLIYLRRPRFEVTATTNAGEQVPLYIGAHPVAQRISGAISQAMVSNQMLGSHSSMSQNPPWVQV